MQLYLTESVQKVVLQDLIPAQIRQLILYISNNRGQVDGFVWELTFDPTPYLSAIGGVLLLEEIVFVLEERCRRALARTRPLSNK